MLFRKCAGGSAAVAEFLKEKGEPLGPGDASDDQHRYGGDAEDEEDASEVLRSDSNGLNSQSSRAAAT